MEQDPRREGGISVLRQVLDIDHPDAAPGNLLAGGIAAGARIYTLDGALPVEFLEPGDRVVTRAGARRLRRVVSGDYAGSLIRVAPGALGHDRPGAPLLLGSAARLLMRDWRVEVIYGKREALVPAQAMVDGRYVTLGRGHARLFRLEFEVPEVIYADGVEIAAAAESAQV
ncbi:MAG: hypothetical protein EP320_09190 [Rhodobacteraceae bacterium]|nr:MAG: hypothetical protein EP320_09190 [Paracoccaceae bacterium]